MDKASPDTPYVVAIAFFDDEGANMLQMATHAPSREIAAAKATAAYYLNGGKRPFQLISVLEIEESVARAVVELFDRNRAQEEAEAAKVVGLCAVATEEPA